MLGISGKHASFNQFFYPNNDYKLEKTVKNAYKKKASEQTALDRELIRVTERVNIFSMVNTGAFLKIFPVQNSDNYQWINWTDSQAYKPLMGELMIFKQDFMFSDLNYNNIMRNYLISTLHAKESGDYSKPDRLVGQLKSIQRKLGPENLLPSEKKINAEVFYNKANIFEKLKYVYGILGLCLLVLTIIDNFKLWQSRFLPLLISLFIGMMLFSFAIQTFGMGLRWWLGGHAPWSNGYEVLLLVAWGGVLAGFSMVRYSKITLASTALLAFFILMTAGHSYYDPQLTNLNPVLKSYWLIIHVAIITIGYGFLTLGFLTAITNLVLYLFKTGVRKELFTYTIQELTLINEKLLTIGMLLTAVGLYIGCVWANESWGSYWAWNAKQTWSLIIVLVYGLILHFKFIPKMKSELVFNIGAIVAFGSVLMTFIGVNYYFTKGMHSYATDDPPIFPLWAWIAIIALFSLIAAAIAKENIGKKAGHT
ncbi:MAG: cytochrome c biogenesis protein CcsA, partial [Cyclobacteriaceae bacterium]|nr:cytochrome c biogenesis protein CcsA [Cyclobacteriaceae bacterium]